MCAVLLPPTSGGLSRMLSASVGGLKLVNHFATWGTEGSFLSLRACTLSCFTQVMLSGVDTLALIVVSLGIHPFAILVVY